MTDESLDSIAADALAAYFDEWPVAATKLGIRDRDEAVPDVSEEGKQVFRDRYAQCLRRVDALDPSTLDAEAAVQRSTMSLRLRREIERLDASWAEFDVGVSFAGAPSVVLHSTPQLNLDEPGHAQALVERCRRFPTMLAQSADRLRAGVAKGRVPVVTAVDASVSELDEYLAMPLNRDPIVTMKGPSGWDGEGAWREQLREVVERDLRPALLSYRDALVREVRPVARSADKAGLCWLPDGEELYAAATAEHTTTDRTAEEIHADGLRVLDEIGAEVDRIAPAALGTRGLAETFARLRDDLSLRYSSAAEMVADAEAAIDRAWTAAPMIFGRLPAAGCVVKEILPLEAPRASPAYYRPPNVAGEPTPGTYWLNTYEPTTKSRFDAEAIAFHEAVPGHHLQIALALEREVPLFLRLSLFTAYVEGWALYAELLADEMGMYSDDLQRLGLQSTRAMRACRLVVDTGMHRFGWSPERARAFCIENSAWPAPDITREVDRYVAWPGQALGYLVGCLEIQRIREGAREAMGPSFDLRGFHDTVLAHGSLPLATLREIVTDWQTPVPLS